MAELSYTNIYGDLDVKNNKIKQVAQINNVSAEELDILNGATLSTAELNILDGITASTVELNHTKGVTSAIQTQLNGKVNNSRVLTDVPSGAKFTDTTYSAGAGLTLTGTVFTPTFGSVANTICQGNDSRLSNARTPLSHTHSAADLPQASTSAEGIVKIGANLNINNGVLSGIVQEASSNMLNIPSVNWIATDDTYGKYKYEYIFGSGINYTDINYTVEVLKVVDAVNKIYVTAPCTVVRDNYTRKITVYTDDNTWTGILILTSGGKNDSTQSGHEILNSIGTVLTGRTKMQFANGLNATDDGTNGKTVVSLGNHASTGTGYGVSTTTYYGHAMTTSTTPLMDGTVAIGSETSKFARGDHRHPTDTTRIAVADIVNNLTSGGATKVLAAEQGKILKGIIDGKEIGTAFTNISALITAVKTKPQNDYWVGFNLFILTQDVPDFWISGKMSTVGDYSYSTDAEFINDVDSAKATGGLHVGYYKIGRSDLAKVDITNYIQRNQVVNNLVTTTSDLPLSANMGKSLEDRKVDKISGKGLSTNDYDNTEKGNVASNTSARHTHSNKTVLDGTTASYTTDEKNKLSGVEAGANNYTHPANHPATIITQTSSYRFVTDTEKNTWNNKADTDTKNTAGSTDTSSKIYLVGATSQGANPQTYSDNEVYVTSGALTTKTVSIGGGNCTLQYSDEAVKFVFS